VAKGSSYEHEQRSETLVRIRFASHTYIGVV